MKRLEEITKIVGRQQVKKWEREAGGLYKAVRPFTDLSKQEYIIEYVNVAFLNRGIYGLRRKN